VAATQAELQAMSDRAVAHVLQKQGTDSGRRAGWLMISTILIEAWDLYSISFILVFLKAEYHPNSLLLGLASGSVQLGAVFGALCGGWLADRLGRRTVFIATMVAFIVLAIAQAFAPGILVLAIIRLFLGFPLGSDIASGYAYIMESMPRGKREIMGNRWQGMFGIGEVIAIVVITVMYLGGMDHDLLWRIGLALGALPAAVLLIGRLDLPETAPWLIRQGRFVRAKKVSQEMFGDDLPMLPNADVKIEKPRTKDFLADIWKDPVRKRATIFAWISNAMQGSEFGTFGLYLPIMFVLAGVSGIAGTNFLTGGIYIIATIAGFVAPVITPRLGHRGIAKWGFGMVFVCLLVIALALHMKWLPLVPLGAAVMMWGHYWDASNGMSIASMVSPARYRGIASGFAYIFVKAPSFLSIFLFPSLFDALGVAGATLFVAVFSLVGWLSAHFILPEVYGYVESEQVVAAAGSGASA
jgi:MFS family permease